MKYLLIVGDGMADYPIHELNNLTPLQAAKTPNMNFIATKGSCGLLKTVPEGLPPGSGTAILSVLGYDPKKFYTGRGPFEAASRNIELKQNDVAYRCNLITEKNGILVDYSADHISNSESAKLIDAIKKNFEEPGKVEFYTGLGYRHFLILRNYLNSEIIQPTPPHDAMGCKISKVLPKAESKETKGTADLLNRLICNSKKVLNNHPVNKIRRKDNKKPGNMIWPWSGGKKPRISTFYQKYRIKAAVISAVDLVKGIGIYSGMEIVEVPGVTGMFDTNYEGKAEYALKALKDHNLVFIHIEAPDEAGHSRDYDLKVRTIEDLDKRLLGLILDGLNEDCVIGLLPDHPTPVEIGIHTDDFVPFAIYSPLFEGDTVKEFNEFSVKNGKYGLISGNEFMKYFLEKVS